jgi:hypothetical protein
MADWTHCIKEMGVVLEKGCEVNFAWDSEAKRYVAFIVLHGIPETEQSIVDLKISLEKAGTAIKFDDPWLGGGAAIPLDVFSHLISSVQILNKNPDMLDQLKLSKDQLEVIKLFHE